VEELRQDSLQSVEIPEQICIEATRSDPKTVQIKNQVQSFVRTYCNTCNGHGPIYSGKQLAVLGSDTDPVAGEIR
jgi:hypothetical protein